MPGMHKGPNEVLTDFNLTVLVRAHSEQGMDGILTSDDIGTQTGPFFRAEVF
jgi:uroporphyrinogen decarboxylase